MIETSEVRIRFIRQVNLNGVISSSIFLFVEHKMERSNHISSTMKLTLCVGLMSLARAQLDTDASTRVPKQAAARSGVQDQNSAETGFGGGGGGGIENSKYFHYQHLPEHDKYEFGYRRGNDHHVRERYEKAVPHEGHFKTKVRWADHKGGQGEHYWDYNHAGHGGEDGEGGYSDPVPSFADSQNANSDNNLRLHHKRQSDLEASRRAFSYEKPSEDVRNAFRPQAPKAAATDHHEGFVKSFEDEVGSIESFDIQRDSSKPKIAPTLLGKQYNEPVRSSSKGSQRVQRNNDPHYVFDMETGRVIDEQTGKTYFLQPIST